MTNFLADCEKFHKWNLGRNGRRLIEKKSNQLSLF